MASIRMLLERQLEEKCYQVTLLERQLETVRVQIANLEAELVEHKRETVIVVLKRIWGKQRSYRRPFVGLTLGDAIERLNGEKKGERLPNFRMAKPPFLLNGHSAEWGVILKAGDKITAWTIE